MSLEYLTKIVRMALAASAVFALAACNPFRSASGISDSAPLPVTTIPLSAGRFTPLGRVPKADKPTASEFADLQTTESGKLNQAAFVEFYADN